MRGTEFEPTAEQRALVESASAFGITQAEIANQLKIDEKTLRKHFRDELSSGKFKVDMTAGKTHPAYNLAWWKQASPLRYLIVSRSVSLRIALQFGESRLAQREWTNSDSVIFIARNGEGAGERIAVMSQLLPSVEVSAAVWRPAGILGVTPCGQLALGPAIQQADRRRLS
jgi:hypothetical protein